MGSKPQKERVSAVSEYLTENGIRFEIEDGTKHARLVLFFEKERRKLFLAGSPGDCRGLKNFVSDVRRAVISMIGYDNAR